MKWKKFERDFAAQLGEKENPNLDIDALKRKVEIEPSRPKLARPYVNYARITGKALGIAFGVLFATVILIPSAFLLIAFARVENVSYNVRKGVAFVDQKPDFSKGDNAPVALNSIEYPDKPTRSPLDPSYVEGVNQFAFEAYNGLNSGEENFFFSPLSLYFHLDLLSPAISSFETDLNAAMNALLVSEKAIRDDNFYSAFFANRIEGGENNSTVQMYNGAFFDRKFNPNPTYLSFLTSRYAEAYQLDLPNGSKFLSEWANSRLGEKAMSPSDFPTADDLAFYLLSSLSFQGKWWFNKNDTYGENFYPASGSNYVVPFMHSSFTGKVYDYGDYVSVFVSFDRGYQMEYFVPRLQEDNISDILEAQSRNFLLDDEAFRVKTEAYKGGPLVDSARVKLSLPRFEASNFFSLKEGLSTLGLSKLFDENGNRLQGAFADMVDYSYILDTKQKNTIRWDEDGAVAKTLTFSFGAAGSAAPNKDGVYDIKLNQPFVYVLRDPNGLPLYLGRVDNIPR